MSESSSLERMLDILGLFDEARPEWTPAELAAQLGYSRPTLYRYLKTLKGAGLIASVDQSTYTVGPRVVELDYLLRRADPLVPESDAEIQALATRFPGTAFVSRWYRDRVLCINSVSLSEDVVSSFPRGRPMPVGRGATSHVILAHLPRRQLLPLIEPRLDDYRQIGFGADLEAVLARYRAIRKDGYIVSRGEVQPGVVGTAAPIFGAGPTPIGSLCLTLSDRQFAPHEPAAMGREIALTAARIGARLASRRHLEAAE
ncbi:DNA-binding IclR family transcriptional regulator [Amorphus suaedae]